MGRERLQIQICDGKRETSVTGGDRVDHLEADPSNDVKITVAL